MSACRLCVADTEPSCVTEIIAERDQLRTDLAAAVAERDRLIAAMARSCDEARNELHECQLAFDWRQRAEQAEARLAAIEAAPTVAVIVRIGQMKGSLLIARHKAVPAVDTELIARPAKD